MQRNVYAEISVQTEKFVYKQRNLCFFFICVQTENFIKRALAAIVMQKAGNTYLQFPNRNARWFPPIVLYFDTQSYLGPIATAQPSPSTSYTVAIEKMGHVVLP